VSVHAQMSRSCVHKDKLESLLDTLHGIFG